MTVQHTTGPLHVEAGGGRYDDDGEWDSVIIVPDADNETMLAELLWRQGDAAAEAQTRADADLFAGAPALADTLEEFLRDATPSLDTYEDMAADFRRDTGFLAPGKDEAAAVNSGVTMEQRRAAWNEWAGKRMDARNARARAALRAAGRLP